MSGRRYQLTSIPDAPRDTPAELRRILNAMKEAIEVRNGVRGDPLEEVVTKKDLVEGGLATYETKANTTRGKYTIVPGGTASGMPTVQRPTTPRLAGRGMFGGVVLMWNPPTQAYKGHAVTEIWMVRGEHTNDRRNAVLVDEATGFSFSYGDAEDGEVKYTFWIRFRNLLGQVGAFSSFVHLTKVPDPKYLIAKMEEEINDLQVVKDLQESAVDTGNEIRRIGGRAMFRINNEGVATGFGLEADAKNGSSFVIMADRFAVIGDGTSPTVPFSVVGNQVFMDNAVIRDSSISDAKIGSITVGKITDENRESIFRTPTTFSDEVRIEKLKVTNANILGDIYSQNSSGQQTWRLNQDGNFRLGPASGANRVEMDPNGLRVYHNGVEVVRIGRL